MSAAARFLAEREIEVFLGETSHVRDPCAFHDRYCNSIQPVATLLATVPATRFALFCVLNLRRGSDDGLIWGFNFDRCWLDCGSWRCHAFSPNRSVRNSENTIGSGRHSVWNKIRFYFNPNTSAKLPQGSTTIAQRGYALGSTIVSIYVASTRARHSGQRGRWNEVGTQFVIFALVGGEGGLVHVYSAACRPILTSDSASVTSVAI